MADAPGGEPGAQVLIDGDQAVVGAATHPEQAQLLAGFFADEDEELLGGRVAEGDGGHFLIGGWARGGGGLGGGSIQREGWRGERRDGDEKRSNFGANLHCGISGARGRDLLDFRGGMPGGMGP